MNVVINEITKYNLNIVALQEIRWPGNGSFKHKETTIFYSGCKDNKHAFGVGIMINNRLLENFKRFGAINERICYIRLKIKEQLVIIFSCHAPTEEKDGETKDIFYDELEQVYKDTPRHAIKIILGDMNAKIVRENMYRPTIGKESFHSISNDNGARLIHFAMSNGIIISSTYFQRKNIHKHDVVMLSSRVLDD